MTFWCAMKLKETDFLGFWRTQEASLWADMQLESYDRFDIEPIIKKEIFKCAPDYLKLCWFN